MRLGCRARVGVVLLAALAVFDSALAADSIRLIVPFGRGGATDVIFREIAPHVGRFLGEPVIVTNVPGVSATRGATQVKDAEPDGYTLLATHQALSHSYLAGAVQYSHRDFSPVALLLRTVNIPTTYAGHPVQRSDQIANYIDSHVGQARVGIVAHSTANDFWQKFMTIVNIAPGHVKLVSFPDSASQITALLGREIDFAMLDLPSAGYLYATGSLVPLGVAHSERLSRLPDVPTLEEQDIPMIYTSDRGVFAPRGTPPNRLLHLAQGFGDALKDEELARYLDAELGSFIDYRPLDQFQAYLDQQESELGR